MSGHKLVSNIPSTDVMLSDTLFLVSEKQQTAGGQAYVSRSLAYNHISGQLSTDLGLPAVWESQRAASAFLSDEIHGAKDRLDTVSADLRAVSSDVAALETKTAVAQGLADMAAYISPLSNYPVWRISSEIDDISSGLQTTRSRTIALSSGLSELSAGAALSVATLGSRCDALGSRCDAIDGQIGRLWLSALIKAPGEHNVVESDNEFTRKPVFQAGAAVSGSIAVGAAPGASQATLESDGRNTAFLKASAAGSNAFLAVVAPADGKGHLSASSVKGQGRTLAQLAAGAYVATTDWASDTNGANNLLHTAGDETAYGVKTFSGRVVAQSISARTFENAEFSQMKQDIRDLQSQGGSVPGDIADIREALAEARNDINGLSGKCGDYAELSAPTKLFLDGDHLKMMSNDGLTSYSQADLSEFDNAVESVYLSVQNPDPTGQQAHLPQGRYLHVRDRGGNDEGGLLSDLYVGDCINNGGVYNASYTQASNKYVTIENYKVKLTDWAVAEFTRDRLLESVELSTGAQSKQYLVFHFKLAGGAMEDVALPLTTLVNVYCDGEGVSINDSTGEVSLTAASDTRLGGIKLSSSLSDNANRKYGLKASSGAGYVNVQWTEQKGFVSNSATGTSNVAAATTDPYFNIANFVGSTAQGVATSTRLNGSGPVKVVGQNGNVTFGCDAAAPCDADGTGGSPGLMTADDKRKLDWLWRTFGGSSSADIIRTE